jgi:hypothetical protein
MGNGAPTPRCGEVQITSRDLFDNAHAVEWQAGICLLICPHKCRSGVGLSSGWPGIGTLHCCLWYRARNVQRQCIAASPGFLQNPTCSLAVRQSSLQEIVSLWPASSRGTTHHQHRAMSRPKKERGRLDHAQQVMVTRESIVPHHGRTDPATRAPSPSLSAPSAVDPALKGCFTPPDHRDSPSYPG